MGRYTVISTRTTTPTTLAVVDGDVNLYGADAGTRHITTVDAATPADAAATVATAAQLLGGMPATPHRAVDDGIGEAWLVLAEVLGEEDWREIGAVPAGGLAAHDPHAGMGFMDSAPRLRARLVEASSAQQAIEADRQAFYAYLAEVDDF